MAQLLAGRFNRFVEKLFSTKEGGPSLYSISPEIVIQGSILNGIEDRYLLGWNRFMFTITQAAVAAANSAVELRNPVGSSGIAVIEKVNVLPAASSLVQMVVAAGTGDLGTPISQSALRIDRRGNPNSQMILSQGTNAPPTGVSQFRMLSTAANNVEFISTTDQEITILPGDVFLLIDETVNQQCSFAVMWRERVLEPSELS